MRRGWPGLAVEARQLEHGPRHGPGSVHATAKRAFVRQLEDLDPDVIRRPSVDVPWMNDLAHFAFQQVVGGRRFIVGGDWNTSRLFDERGAAAPSEFEDQASRDGWVETHIRLVGEET